MLNIYTEELITYSLGGVSAAIYAYLSEFNIPRHRAVAINYSTMFVSVSAIYVPGNYKISQYCTSILSDSHIYFHIF